MRILRDNKEKRGFWTFGRQNPCKLVHLKTGDYTLEGYEDLLAIERKKTVSEIHQNISKLDKDRFWREMDRLKEFKYAYVLLEFTYEDMSKYPFNLPYKVRKKIKVRGGYLHDQISRIESMGIKVIFCGDRQGAINIARKIFEEVISMENVN